MAENGENEAKPQVEQHIQIKVRSQDGNEVVFKVKRTTPFRKVMTAYCDRMSQNVANLVFLFDGQRIREDQAPGELEMEDGDTVDAMIHQEGGSGRRIGL